MNVLLSSEDARALIWNALTGSGTSPENAGYFTDAILDTELRSFRVRLDSKALALDVQSSFGIDYDQEGVSSRDC